MIPIRIDMEAIVYMSVDSILIDPYRNHIGFGRLHNTAFISYRINQHLHVNGEPIRYEIVPYSFESDIV